MTRHPAIVAAVQAATFLSVRALAEQFGVSSMTIYRDLQTLAAQGVIIRTAGGAMRPPPVADGGRVPAPLVSQRLGAAAAARLRPGETVFLDAGVMPWAVAENLPPTYTGTVVTPSLPAAATLSGRPGVTVLMPGGQVSGEPAFLRGLAAMPFLEALHVDTYICSVVAVREDAGLLDRGLTAVEMKRMMIAHANRILVVGEATIFAQTAPFTVAPLTMVDELITDTRVPDGVCQRLIAAGLEVIRVPYAPDLEAE